MASLIDTFSSLSLEIFNFIIYIKMIQFVSQARLCQNGGGYFAGENLTYADLMLVVVNDNLRLMKMTMMIMIKQCHQIKHNNLSFQVREGWGGKRDWQFSKAFQSLWQSGQPSQHQVLQPLDLNQPVKIV